MFEILGSPPAGGNFFEQLNLNLSHSESLDIGAVNLLSESDKECSLVNVETRARNVLALADLIAVGFTKTDQAEVGTEGMTSA